MNLGEQMQLDFSEKPQLAQSRPLSDEGSSANVISFAEAASDILKSREEELVERVRSWGPKQKTS